MKQGAVEILIVDRTVVVLGRKYRSKWWNVTCMCNGYRRKDGSCRHERLVMDLLPAGVRERARIAPKGGRR